MNRLRRKTAVRLSFGLLFVLAAAACGDGGSTEPGTPPTAMVPISMAMDTVVTGESTDPPISVRVEDVLGNPVEGTPVRFLITGGDGSLSPGVAVAGEDGVAESVFRAGPTPGETSIRVDIPSAPNVAPLEFFVLAEAADTVLLTLVEGAAQTAEVGSQLPLPFRIRAQTTGSSAAGGVEIAFRLAGGGSNPGMLTNESVLTEGDGGGQTVLTLGSQAREYRVDAYATGGVFSDTVTFTATAVTSLDGPVGLDSVSVAQLVAGGQATLFGRGFSAVPGENDVRIEGVPANVLTSTGTQLTIDVPDFVGSCLPARDVGVRVLVGANASNGELIPILPAETAVDLAVGEALALKGPGAVDCLQFPASDEPQEFRLVVGNASRVPGSQLSTRLLTRAPAELAGAGVSAVVAPNDLDAGLVEAALARVENDHVIRVQALETLREDRIAASRLAAPTNIQIPVVGETLEHFFAIGSNLAASCSDTTNRVQGLVRYVGEHLALVEDVARPEGGLTDDEWLALGDELDQVVAPVDTAYFGGYEDIDANGRVIVLFTPEVNKLGDGEAGVGGFFLPLDLAASGRGGDGLPGAGGEVCPASNEAEILYIITADPDGRVGPVVDKDRALRNARGLVAHELQHLISAERRVLHAPGGFAAAEEVWLDEALSQVAEEVAGLALIGQGVGGDYTFDQVANTRSEFDTFNAFHLNNFLNLSFYMFGTARAQTISPVDPGGILGLQMRGFGWFMARWLADQRGGDERAFFKSIVGGGQNFNRGIANLERVTGADWADLLADFAITLAADDADIDQLPSRFAVSTWDFRDVFASLNQNTAARSLFPLPFPLQAVRLGFETSMAEIDVGASTVQYFSLASGLDAPPLSVALRSGTGAPLGNNTEPLITIVRTR